MEEQDYSYTSDRGSDSKLTEDRRRKILENLKKEREKRKQAIEKGEIYELEAEEDVPLSYNLPCTPSNNSQKGTFRSEIINKLLEERRKCKETSPSFSLTSPRLSDTIEESKEYLKTKEDLNCVKRLNIEELVSPKALSRISDQPRKSNRSRDEKFRVSSKVSSRANTPTSEHKPTKREIKPKLAKPPKPSKVLGLSKTEIIESHQKASQAPKAQKEKEKKLLFSPDNKEKQRSSTIVSTSKIESQSPVKSKSKVSQSPSHKKSPRSQSNSSPKTRPKDVIFEAEKKTAEECTFQPKILPLPKSKQFNYKTDQLDKSTQDRLNDLAKPKNQRLRELERLKKERDKLMQAECTFQPKITDYHFTSKYLDSEPVDERLHNEAKLKSAIREKLIQEKELMDMETYSFKPKVTDARAYYKPPIYKRVQELQSEKTEYLDNLRHEIEDAQKELTFHPKLNLTSEKILKKKRNKSNELETSTEKAAKEVKQRLKLPKQSQRLIQQQEEEFTFAPNILQRASSQYLSVDLADNFLERQEMLAKKYLMKKEEKLIQLENEEQCTFKPKINTSSKNLIEQDSVRKSQTLEEKAKRLSEFDMKIKEEKIAKRQEDYYSKFSFEPSINPALKYLARVHDIDELAYNPKSQLKKKFKEQERNYELLQKCTFKPVINSSKKYYSVCSRYSKDTDIIQEIQYLNRKKEIKADEIRKEIESEKMKDCTFRPVVKKTLPNEQDGPIIIRGLDRFLELKDLYRKQQEELKERKEKLFRLNPTGTFTVTSPQPFNITKCNKDEKVAKLKSEHDERILSECTFKPNTKEYQNKQILSKLLNRSSICSISSVM